MNVEQWVARSGQAIEFFGVGVLIVGLVLASAAFLGEWRGRGLGEAYNNYRANLGRAILLGLEFMVVGDIIRTVAIELTFENLGELAIIVLIRTFLSFALETEVSGQLPWRRRSERLPAG